METSLRKRNTSDPPKKSSSDNQNALQNPTPQAISFDANRYASKQSFTQNCLNVALVTSNAKQLKKMAMLGPEHQTYYYPMVGLVLMSIVLQAIMGILCVIVGRININVSDAYREKANKINGCIACIALLITIINIVASAFVI